MPTTVHKVILFNKSALKEKYGTGTSKVTAAVARLVKADKARGISSKSIAMDDSTAMKSFGSRVKDPLSPKENKAAVDAICRKLSPQYILLLGAPDVVPHQDLGNPLFSADDPDEIAYSDLPYACDAPYSQRIGDFIGPTRVVGRLPDVNGATEPSALITLLDMAANAVTLPMGSYDAYFGLTATVWRRSTAESLVKTFGSSNGLLKSPNDGPAFIAAALQRRCHFINCHGSPSDPAYYGQSGSSYPTAHHADRIQEIGVLPGTVVAAECCYGAELYPPLDGHRNIAMSYLLGGAYGMVGSTTIAYGPAVGNGEADLVCQYFLQQVRRGASLGRAMLMARHKYVQAVGTMSPVDLKTIAQFNLLGDPSIHPVPPLAVPGDADGDGVPDAVVPHGGGKSAKLMKAIEMVGGLVASAAAGAAASEGSRDQRRMDLVAKGLSLAAGVICASAKAKIGAKAASAGMTEFLKLARSLAMKPDATASFEVEIPAGLKMSASAKAMMPRRFMVATEVTSWGDNGTPCLKVMVAGETDGRLVKPRVVESK